jgi:hypothetical protein
MKPLIRPIRKLFLFTLFVFVSANFVKAYADPFKLPEFSYAQQVEETLIDQSDYLVLLSSPKKVNGELRADSQLRLDAQGKADTLEINSGHDPEEAFQFYKAHYAKLGAQMLFQCEARDCGSSNIWANSIFNVSRLYGQDRTQHYYVGLYSQNRHPYMVILYTVLRDNGRSYAHVEILKIRDINTLGDFQKRLSFSKHFFIIDFPDEGLDVPNLDAETMKSLLSEIKTQQKKSIYLIAFRSSGYESISEAMSESKAMNDLIKDWLVKQSVDPARIKTLSVGPLVPISSQKRQGNRVEILLLNDKASASENSMISSEIGND